MKRKILSVITLCAIGVVATALPAEALQRNCSSSTRLCVYYNSSGYGLGAEFGTDAAVPSFNPYVTANDIYFKAGAHGSAGAGSWVWNNGAALNNSGSIPAAMFENSDYQGRYDWVEVRDFRNLDKTKNNNASVSSVLP